MYTFCTKNVQNGTVKLVFLTKKTCQKSSNFTEGWTVTCFPIASVFQTCIFSYALL